MSLAVLLRNGMHATPSGDTREASIRYALNCDSAVIQFQKTPIQIPIPQQSPELFDLGIVRPSISISGIVDTVGGDTSNTTAGVEHMESLSITRRYWAWASSASTYTSIAKTYYIPYKNKLEEAIMTWIASNTSGDIANLELEIGDANFPVYGDAAETNVNHVDDDLTATLTNASGTSLTGGSVYEVAIQSARVEVDPGTEDRYTFQMQFVATSRKDIIFPTN